MSDPTPLRRDQLARFLPDNDSIRAFERLFKVAGDLTPTQIDELIVLIEETTTNAGTATSVVTSALEQISSLAQELKESNTEQKINELISSINSFMQEASVTLGSIEAKINSSKDYIKLLNERIQKTVSITASYSAMVGNYSILADATAGAITVTLPLASSSESYIIGVTKTDISANTVTIARSGTDLIAGSISQSLIVDNEVYNFISDGSNWQLVN